MKHYLIIINLLLPCFTLAQDTTFLSLEQAIEQALQHNQELRNKRLDIEYANAQVKEVLSTGLPQINANANFSHNLEIQTMVMPDFISPSVYGVLFEENVIAEKEIAIGSFPAQFGVPYSLQATVGLNQLVFDGTFFLGLKAASEYVNISRLLASQSEIAIKEAVTKSYYMALLSQKNLLQFEQSLTNLLQLRDETKALYESGFAEKLDYDRIVLSVSNMEINTNNLRKQTELAEKMLLYVMGAGMEQNIKLNSSIPEFNTANFSENYGSTETANRIEMEMLEQQKRINTLNLKRYKMGYIPNLYLNANYGYNTFAQKDRFGDLGDTWYPIASYGLNLNIPVFDGLYKKSKMDQVRVDIMKTENSIEQLKNGIAFETQQAYSAYLHAFRNMEFQKNNITLAESIYNTTAAKFKEGMGSSFELVQAESDFTTANTNYLNALYELNITKLNLDKALGKL